MQILCHFIFQPSGMECIYVVRPNPVRSNNINNINKQHKKEGPLGSQYILTYMYTCIHAHYTIPFFFLAKFYHAKQ